MSTRSTIAMVKDGGKVIGVYCHFDGYLSHNGKILFEHYKDAAKIEELIMHGDMSILGSKINPNPDYPHEFVDAQNDVCVFYNRDRGEPINAMAYNSIVEFYKNGDEEDYNYLFKDGKWVYRRCGRKPWNELTADNTKEW